MVSHSSATTRQQTPHVNRRTRTATIMDALKRRAQAVLNDRSIDAQSRAIIRYALETNDPWLAQLVNRADAGENIADVIDSSQIFETNEAEASAEKIEALAEIICGAGYQSAAALFVLMGTLENSTHPKLHAHTAKRFAFTRCGELNVYGRLTLRLQYSRASYWLAIRSCPDMPNKPRAPVETRALGSLENQYRSSRHYLDCSKLVEVMIKGESDSDIELFHDDFAGAVSEASILVVELLEYFPCKRQVSGSDLMYFGKAIAKEFCTKH